MSRSSSRFAVFICNILIVALSAAAVLSYFLMPLWRVNVSYLLREEQLKEMLPEDMAEIDVGEIVGDGIELSVTVELESSDVVAAFTDSDPAQTVERAIERNVDAVVDQLTPVLDEIAEKAVRAAARQSVNEIVRDQIKNLLDPDAYDDIDARVEEVLDKAGFTEAYINEKTDAFIDAVYAENATVDTVASVAVGTAEEVLEKLRASGEEEFADAVLTDERKAEIESAVSDALSTVANEDGSIDMQNFVASLLLEFLRSSDQSADESTDNAPSEGAVASLSDFAETETDGSAGTDAQEELKAEIKSFLLDKIPDGTADTVVLALKIAGGVIAFTMLTWAYLVLKILCKMFAKNPAVKLKLPIWLGWLPFLVLVLLPTVLLRLAKGGALSSLIPAETLAAMEGISLSFFSAGWVAFAAAIALIVLFIPYGIFRRRLRRAARGDEDSD